MAGPFKGKVRGAMIPGLPLHTPGPYILVIDFSSAILLSTKNFGLVKGSKRLGNNPALFHHNRHFF